MAREDVRHDAVSLYRFVDSICSFCGTASESPAYLPASKRFLTAIDQLGNKTKEYLTSFHQHLPDDPAAYSVYRQGLTSLRYAWFEIHRRVKPVADADTLHLPSALIQVLVRRLRVLAEFSSADFAVLHTEKLNFLQVIGTGMRDTFMPVAAITGADPLPDDLGLIGIPYSQTQSVFLNCLIAHEMAHFVFGEKKLRNLLAPKIIAALNTKLAKSASAISAADRYWLPGIFADVLEELFCDSFAIRFIGPCYAFAFIEIFDIGNVIDKSGAIKADSSPSLAFSDSYPADLYRIKRLAEILIETEWWNHIENSNSLHVKLLKEARFLKDSTFTLPPFSKWQQEILEAFFTLIPEIETFSRDLLSSLDSGLKEYGDLKGKVHTLLLHGVVPSNIIDPATGESMAPSPITVLNVAFLTYLDHMADLMNKIDGQDADVVRDRVRWTEKLEMWTLKALEDYELTTQAAGM